MSEEAGCGGGCCGGCGGGRSGDTVQPSADERRRIAGFVLGSLLAGYPEDGYAAQVHMLADQMERPVEPALAKWLAGPVDDIRAAYVDLFERGKAPASPHESDYDRPRGVRKTAVLADLRGFYKAFSLDFAEGPRSREMPDHVSVELEFYALLLMKQAYLDGLGDEIGGEVVRDARVKFLREHLGRFVDALAGTPAVAGHPYYGPAFAWCRSLIADECATLAVEPERLGAPEPGAASCGGGCGCG